MKKKSTKNSVLALTKAYLLESNGDSLLSEKESEDSLDNQVDRYLADYESEAKSSKKESKDWRSTVRRILEADEDENDSKGDVELTQEDIDVSSFTNSVIRLIENYDSLLEVRNTLLRRSINFLEKSYNSEVIDAFKNSLREEHGIEIGKSKSEVEDDFEAPPADRAGPIGSAGGAGGM